jgi:hypothetical protein
MFNTSSLIGDTIICANSTSSYKPGTSGGKWFVSDTTIARVDSLGNVFGKKGGVTTLYYTLSSFGVSDTVSKSIKINEIQQPVIKKDTSNYLISSYSNGNKWYLDNKLLADTIQTIKPTINGNYTVTVTKNGCTSISSIPYNFILPPVKTIVTLTGDSILCINGTSNYKASSSGGKWYIDDTTIAKIDTTAKLTGIKGGSTILNYVLTTNGVYDTTRKTIKIIQLNQPIISRDTANYLRSNYSFGNIWFKETLQLKDTAQKLKPTTNGNYSVKVSQDGCSSSISNNYYYVITDIINFTNGQYIKVSPNPFKGYLYFDFNILGYQNLNVEIIDVINGRIIEKQNKLRTGAILYLNQLITGTYILHIYSDDLKFSKTIKLLKI